MKILIILALSIIGLGIFYVMQGSDAVMDLKTATKDAITAPVVNGDRVVTKFQATVKQNSDAMIAAEKEIAAEE